MKTKAELIAARKAHLAAARSLVDAADAEGRDLTREEHAKASAHLGEANLIKKQLDELEPEAARRRKAEEDAALKQQILALTGDADPDFQRAWDAKHRGRGQRQAGAQWSKAFMEALPYQPRTGRKDLLPASGSVTVQPLSDTIGTLNDDDAMPQTILQIIPISPTSADQFAYLRETVREQHAAPVPAGQKKPTSIYTLERVTDTVRTIAHLSEPIPRQWLADAPALQQYLDRTLRAGVILELENQVINGDGSDENFTGLLNTPGILVQQHDTNVIVTARKAITYLEQQPIQPTAWMINPADWERFELSQDQGGEFLMGPAGSLPVDRANRRLWGLPVALTLGVPEGTGLLGDWRTACELLEREETRIDWSEAFHIGPTDYDSDGHTGFEANLVKFRGEGRWGLQVFRPTAICEVELDGGS